MRTTTTRERLTRSLNALRARHSRPPAPASRPCSGPCGCELVGDIDGDELAAVLADPSGWIELGDGTVEVRVLSDAEARRIGLEL